MADDVPSGFKLATYTHPDGFCSRDPLAEPDITLFVPDPASGQWTGIGGVSCGACGVDLAPVAG